MKWRILKMLLAAAEGLSGFGARFLARGKVLPGEILILTAYTPEIENYAKVAAENKRAYADRHGYRFKAITSGFERGRPPAWSKIRFIKRELRNARWVFWSDADALFMNGDIRLESFINGDFDIHLNRAYAPFPHINTGHMFFRRSLFADLFLAAVWRLDAFTNDPTWEQGAVNYLLNTVPFRRVRISDNREFNSYGHVENDPHPYQEGDFVIHFPGVKNKPELMQTYADRLQQPTGPSN